MLYNIGGSAMATIGENIRRIRKEKGLTQKQLGALCEPEMADSAIRRYELGNANPKLDTLRKIANALDVPFSDLVPFEEGLHLWLNEKRANKTKNKENDIVVIDTDIDEGHNFNVIKKKLDIGKKLSPEEILIYNQHIKQATETAKQSLEEFGKTLKKCYAEYYELLNEKGAKEADKIIEKNARQAQEQSEEQVKLLTKIPEYCKEK